MHSAQRQVALLAALAWAMILAGGCGSADRAGAALESAEDAISASSDSTPSSVVSSTLVSTTSRVAADPAPQPLTGSGSDPDDAPDDALDAEFAGVEEALAAVDLCGVYNGLAGLPIDSSTVGLLIPKLARIADVMERARSLVDADLIDDWDELGDDIGKVATELRRHPDHTESAAEVYEDPAYRSAQTAVDEAMKESCG